MERAGDCNAFWNKKLKDDGWTVLRTSLHVTEPEINYICQELVRWAKEEDVIKVGMFHVYHDINFDAWGEWLKKYPQLRAAYRMAKYIIGERRERKGLKGEYNANIVNASALLYDEEQLNLRKELMALNKRGDDDSVRQTIVVVRDKMPETDDVPTIRGGEGTE
jgi:hypothetical protein